jgi:hypothetical protein
VLLQATCTPIRQQQTFLLLLLWLLVVILLRGQLVTAAVGCPTRHSPAHANQQQVRQQQQQRGR